MKNGNDRLSFAPLLRFFCFSTALGIPSASLVELSTRSSFDEFGFVKEDHYDLKSCNKSSRLPFCKQRKDAFARLGITVRADFFATPRGARDCRHFFGDLLSTMEQLRQT
jgi:hypothetical protein